jgi:serine/threonine protein phosphatase PrpC
LALLPLVLALKLHHLYKFKDKESANPFSSGEPTSLRITLALVSALILGLYGCITEGFTLHAFFALLFYLIATGTLTFLLSGMFSRSAFRGFFYDLGLLTLSFCIVFASNAFAVFGFSLSLTLSTLILLLFARKKHPVFCAFGGLALGIACGKGFAPVLAILALTAAVFYKLNRKIAPWISVLCAFAFSFYAFGSSAFLYILPDLVCGLILFAPTVALLEKRNEKQAITDFFPEREQAEEGLLAGSVETLSEKLSTLSSALRLPSKEESLRICRKGSSEICRECGKECFSKKEALHGLSDTLFETGRLLYELPPKSLFTGCTRWRLLCDQVNNDYALYLEKLASCDRAECYALCYKGVARLLKDRQERSQKESVENEQLGALFKSALDRLKIGYLEASAQGERTVILKAEGVNLGDISKGAFDLRAHFEKHCGLSLSLPELIVNEKEQSLRFYRRPALRAVMGAVSEKKQDEHYCGDTVYSFLNNNYHYFILCDGMGSGREAALVSRIACHFIEQLTYCGGSLETILQTVNDFLLGQSCECSTTVDLLRLDLYSGRCDFVKSGACPSLVLRAGNVFKVASASMPIGATRETNCELISLTLKEGDTVIIASDGIASDIEGAPWLTALLTGKLKDDPQGLSEDILALSKKEDKRPDDRSVLVLKIEQAKEEKKV